MTVLRFELYFYVNIMFILVCFQSVLHS